MERFHWTDVDEFNIGMSYWVTQLRDLGIDELPPSFGLRFKFSISLNLHLFPGYQHDHFPFGHKDATKTNSKAASSHRNFGEANGNW